METLSNNFKKTFLIKFTEELIRNSEVLDFNKLQELIHSKERKRFIPEEKKEIVQEIEKKIIYSPKQIPAAQTKNIIQLKEIAKPTLFIPEPKLPEHLEYLKPKPTQRIEIDLWKLNPLIKDNGVKTIEVNPDEKVVVTGAMGTRPTSISLNKEEIDQVINEFSKRAKIPVEEGIYRVVLGDLILSAIVSEVIGSKFMIKKMAIPIPKAPVAPRQPQVQQRIQMPQTQRNDKMFPPIQRPF